MVLQQHAQPQHTYQLPADSLPDQWHRVPAGLQAGGAGGVPAGGCGTIGQTGRGCFQVRGPVAVVCISHGPHWF